MDKLSKIAEMCKAEVSVLINPHKSNYESVREYLETYDEEDYIHSVNLDGDSLCIIYMYPDTPVGFYTLMDNDIESLLTRALKLLEEK